MTALPLNGKALAKRRRAELKEKIDARIQAGCEAPGLAVILVGDDPASAVYVRNKDRAAKEVGIRVTTIRTDADVKQDDLLEQIESLNRDPSVHGILCQLPLPEGLDERRIVSAILPEKDVDGFHPLNVGRLAGGEDALVACTPVGVVSLIEESGIDPEGKEAVIIGRSKTVGRPLFQLLLNKHMTVTVAHSRTKNLEEVCRRADVLIAAVGRAHLVKNSFVKSGAVVIDVGINRLENGSLAGDVDPAAAENAGWLTPVPGGVGPMTIASLLENTLKAQMAAEDVRTVG